MLINCCFVKVISMPIYQTNKSLLLMFNFTELVQCRKSSVCTSSPVILRFLYVYVSRKLKSLHWVEVLLNFFCFHFWMCHLSPCSIKWSCLLLFDSKPIIKITHFLDQLSTDIYELISNSYSCCSSFISIFNVLDNLFDRQASNKIVPVEQKI